MSFLAFFLSPIGRYVGLGLIVLAVVGGIYGKGRYDDHKAFQARIEREHQKAVEKGTTARNGAVKRFDNGGVRDDGFARD